jgi:hypothetical protein
MSRNKGPGLQQKRVCGTEQTELCAEKKEAKLVVKLQTFPTWAQDCRAQQLLPEPRAEVVGTLTLDSIATANNLVKLKLI